MPVWSYSGVRQTGERISGLVDADSAQSARQKLKKDGILPLALSPHSGAAENRSEKRPAGKKRLGSKDLSLFTRQISILVGAGIPIVDSLGAILDQGGETPISRIASQIREQVKEGRPLSAALSTEPGIFSAIYINMVRAGEESGTLEIMLNRLADLMEKQVNTTRKIVGSLFYPVLLLAVGLLMILFLLVVVMPRITSIFTGLKATLPLPTRILMGTSDWLRTHVLSVGLLSALTIFFLIRFVQKSRGTIDAWALKIPKVGTLVLATQVARFSRTLGVLLSSGTPLQKAMEVSEATVTNKVVREAVSRARQEVSEGDSLSRSLRNSKVFPILSIEEVLRVAQSEIALE